MTEPDIASKVDRQRLAAYERLQAINAELLAALEAAEKALKLTADWALEHFGDHGRYKTTIQSIYYDATKARAVIAKAKPKE